ncbi:MAG: hypothetical protein AAFR75_11315, partial [Pseudomonadota bacterium]
MEKNKMPEKLNALTENETRVSEADQPVIVLNDSDRRSIAITGIFLLLSLHAVYFASAILIPITLALLLSMLFSPVVKAGERFAIPAPASAALVVSGTIIVMIAVVYGLSGSAQEWFERVPQNFFRIEEILAALKEPIEQIKDATDRVEAATEMTGDRPLEVRVERPG